MTFIVKDVVMNEITSAMMMRPQLIQTIPNNLECIPRGTRSPYLTKRKRQLYVSHAKFYRKPFMADDVTTPTQNVSFQDHNWKMVDERNLQRDASLFKTIFIVKQLGRRCDYYFMCPVSIFYEHKHTDFACFSWLGKDTKRANNMFHVYLTPKLSWLQRPTTFLQLVLL